jgi:hypothetical protein
VVQDDEAERERWWRRAAASDLPISPTTVARWDETSERLGECVANATAFALFDTLVAKVGKERASTLAQHLFATPRTGIAALLLEGSPRSLLKTAGTDWDALTAEAERRRLEYREKRGDNAEAHIEISSSADGDVVMVQVKGLEKWNVSFGKLGPWARGQTNLRRLDVRGAETKLPVTLARGDLLLATVDYDDAELACPVRIGARRLEAP